MFRTLLRCLPTWVVPFALLVVPAHAALDAVSGRPVPASPNLLTAIGPGGDPAQVAVSLANGFPLWYRDVEDGHKLQLCLDTQLEVAAGIVVNPCEYEPPLVNAPPSFPGNFGAEGLYWSAASLGTYLSSNGVLNTALLTLALEASGANEAALSDGNQAVFSRIRIRVDVPVAGTYRVTHPYGTRDYVVTTAGVRAIDQTQDFGLVGPSVAQNFLLAMNDAALPPVAPDPFNPGIDIGLVNNNGATIGPFLVPANPHGGTFDANNPATFAGGPITVGETSYIALPFAPNPTNPTVPIDVFQPVTGSPFGTNFFRIELLDPPADFQLNAGSPTPQRVQFDNFLLVGKLFNDALNVAPAAAADIAATAPGSSANIDVVVNDSDVGAAGNFYPINSQALAVADEAGPVLNVNGMPVLTATLPTAMGGTVRRATSISTGRTTFLYTPPAAGFFGSDSFRYVTQDGGGLVSTPALVDITVEALGIARADYRPRFGKWSLRGTSSDSLDNGVTLYAGPRASLTPGQEVQPPAVSSAARGNASLLVSSDAIEFLLSVDPLPDTPITAAHVHAGAAGANGPVIFSLYENFFGIPFTGSSRGTLTAFNLQPRPEAGVGTFADAIAMILAGNAYVNIHTTAYPAGEIRGQLQRPLIGKSVVSDGVWSFTGHANASPGSLPSIMVESDNGVQLLGIPLRLR